MAKRQSGLFGFSLGGDKSGSSSAGGGRRRASTEAGRRRSRSSSNQYSGEWTPSMGTPF